MGRSAGRRRSPPGHEPDEWEGGVWLDAPAQYLSWNFVLISVPNVLMIIGMIVVFLLALVAPFPHEESRQGRSDGHDD